MYLVDLSRPTLLALVIWCLCYCGNTEEDVSPFIEDNFLQLPEGGRVLPTLASGTLGTGTVAARVGDRVAINHGLQEIRLYDVQASITRNTPSALLAPGFPVMTMADFPDGGLAVGSDNIVLIFSKSNIGTGSSPKTTLRVKKSISSVAVLSDGGVAVATQTCVELFTKQEVRTGGSSKFSIANGRVKSLLVLNNGDLAVGVLGQGVMLFDQKALQTAGRPFLTLSAEIFPLDMLEYGSFLAVASQIDGVVFYHKDTWTKASTLLPKNNVVGLKNLSSGGLAVAMADINQGVLLFTEAQALEDQRTQGYGSLTSQYPQVGGSAIVGMNSVHGDGLAISMSGGGVLIYSGSVVATGGKPYTILIPQTKIGASLAFRYEDTCLAVGTKGNGVALFNTTGFRTISESFITLSLQGQFADQPGGMLELRNGMFAVGTTSAVELFERVALQYGGTSVAKLDIKYPGWINVVTYGMAQLKSGELAVGVGGTDASILEDSGGVMVFDESDLYASPIGVDRHWVKVLGPSWRAYSMLALPDGGLAVGLNGGYTHKGGWWGSVWLYNRTAAGTCRECRGVNQSYGILCVGPVQVNSLSMLSDGGLAAGTYSKGVFLFSKQAVETGRTPMPQDPDKDSCKNRQPFSTAVSYGGLASFQIVKSLLPLHNGGLAVGGNTISLYNKANLSESYTGFREPFAILSPDRGTWIKSLVAMGDGNDTLIAAPEVFNSRQCAAGQFALPGDPDCKSCHAGWLSSAGDSVCMYPEFSGWMGMSIVATVVVVLIVLWLASYRGLWERFSSRLFGETTTSDSTCAVADTGGDAGRDGTDAPAQGGAAATGSVPRFHSCEDEAPLPPATSAGPSAWLRRALPAPPPANGGSDESCAAGPSAWIRRAVTCTPQEENEGVRVTTHQRDMAAPLVNVEDTSNAVGQEALAAANTRWSRLLKSLQWKLWFLKYDFVAAAFCLASLLFTNGSNEEAKDLVQEVAWIPPLRTAIGVGLANLMVGGVASLDLEKTRAFVGFRIMGWMIVISVVVLEFVALSKGAARDDVSCQAVWTPLGVGCGENWRSLLLFTLAGFMGLVSIASQARYTWKSYSERPDDRSGDLPCACCLRRIPQCLHVPESIEAAKSWAGMHFLAAANGGIAAVIFMWQLANDIHADDPYRGLLVTCLLLATITVGLGLFNTYLWMRPRYLWLADRHFRLTGVLKYALLVAKTCSLTMPHQEAISDFDCLWSCRVPNLCPRWCTHGNIRGTCTLSETTLADGTVQMGQCFCSGSWFSIATILSSFCSSGLLAVFAFINVWKIRKNEYFHSIVRRRGRRGIPALAGYLIAALSPQGMAFLNLIEVISARHSCLDMGTVAMTLIVMLPMYMVSSDAKWQMASYYDWPTFGALYGENGGSGMRALKPLAICSCGAGMAFLGIMLNSNSGQYCFIIHGLQLILVVAGLMGMCLFPDDFSPIVPAHQLQNNAQAIYDSSGLIIGVMPRSINSGGDGVALSDSQSASREPSVNAPTAHSTAVSTPARQTQSLP